MLVWIQCDNALTGRLYYMLNRCPRAERMRNDLGEINTQHAPQSDTQDTVKPAATNTMPLSCKADEGETVCNPCTL